jgi:hypothetical protein
MGVRLWTSCRRTACPAPIPYRSIVTTIDSWTTPTCAKSPSRQSSISKRTAQAVSDRHLVQPVRRVLCIFCLVVRLARLTSCASCVSAQQLLQILGCGGGFPLTFSRSSDQNRGGRIGPKSLRRSLMKKSGPSRRSSHRCLGPRPTHCRDTEGFLWSTALLYSTISWTVVESTRPLTPNWHTIMFQ